LLEMWSSPTISFSRTHIGEGCACHRALWSGLYEGLDRSGSRAARAYGAYPLDWRITAGPRHFLRQPVAIPSSVDHIVTESKDDAMNRSSPPLAPALRDESSDEAGLLWSILVDKYRYEGAHLRSERPPALGRVGKIIRSPKAAPGLCASPRRPNR